MSILKLQARARAAKSESASIFREAFGTQGHFAFLSAEVSLDKHRLGLSDAAYRHRLAVLATKRENMAKLSLSALDHSAKTNPPAVLFFTSQLRKEHGKLLLETIADATVGQVPSSPAVFAALKKLPPAQAYAISDFVGGLARYEDTVSVDRLKGNSYGIFLLVKGEKVAEKIGSFEFRQSSIFASDENMAAAVEDGRVYPNVVHMGYSPEANMVMTNSVAWGLELKDHQIRIPDKGRIQHVKRLFWQYGFNFKQFSTYVGFDGHWNLGNLTLTDFGLDANQPGLTPEATVRMVFENSKGLFIYTITMGAGKLELIDCNGVEHQLADLFGRQKAAQ